ncbi:MAG: M24 family metallopeptidase [Bacteroidetes bacterium]|nr:M24 family metallopeptidase [Bacteroidota bacterium]
MVHLKSQREIDLMRASADLVGRVLAEVGRHIRPGVTTARLDRVAEDFVHSHGAEPAFKGYRIGQLPPFPGTLCVSINEVVVHGIPSERLLRDGDLVAVDCGVLLNGYYGDSAYTFAVGEISDEDAELCQVTFEALHEGITRAVHGCRIGENTLIGIGSILLNGVTIGRDCLIGANSFLPERKTIPDNSLVMGSPGKVVKTLSDQQKKMLELSAAHYVQNAKRFRDELKIQED